MSGGRKEGAGGVGAGDCWRGGRTATYVCTQELQRSGIQELRREVVLARFFACRARCWPVFAAQCAGLRALTVQQAGRRDHPDAAGGTGAAVLLVRGGMPGAGVGGKKRKASSESGGDKKKTAGRRSGAKRKSGKVALKVWRDDEQEELSPLQIAEAMHMRIEKDIATRCRRLLDIIMGQDGAQVFNTPVDRNDCATPTFLSVDVSPRAARRSPLAAPRS